MDPQWQQFLESQHADIEAGSVRDFGHYEQERQYALEGLCIADLNNFALIQISGADASTFLQGQLTCDIKDIDNKQAALATCCDHKGRMIANFWIWRCQKSYYYLLLPRSLRESLLTHLNKFAAFSKVNLIADDANWIVFGYAGPDAIQHLQKQLDLPIKNNSLTQTADTTVIKVSGQQPRFLVISKIDMALALWQNLAKQAKPVGKDSWNLLDILAGITFIKPQTQELFTPQMINLQLFNGISFTKGCYVGQEVIARTQHLGKLKRHLYQAQLKSSILPNPGDKLTDNQGETIGIIVSASLLKSSEYALLAVIQDRALQHEAHIFLELAKDATLSNIVCMGTI